MLYPTPIAKLIDSFQNLGIGLRRRHVWLSIPLACLMKMSMILQKSFSSKT